MTPKDLHELAGYNRWANLRLLNAAVSLTPEQLDRDMQASFSSLRNTLIHILWGERGWLEFWKAGKFVPRPRPGEYPDMAALQSAWCRHDEGYVAYLGGLTQTELVDSRTLDTTVYELQELVQQALNHSTYHRGQVALLLRQLGVTPPSSDYHDHLAEVREAPAPIETRASTKR